MDIRKIGLSLVVSLCALIILSLLYICRAADNNTFTSWQWVFSRTGILQVFFFLIPALFCAYALSRLQFSGRHTGTCIFLASFAATIPLWQEPELIVDASRYFVQAKYLKEYGIGYFLAQWGNEVNAWTDLPLVPSLYGVIFAVLGESRTYIQLFTSTLFALTALLTFLIGKKLWDGETGVYAGLFLLGIPYLLTQVPLMLVDVSTMFFLTLSIHAFLNAMEKGGPGWTVFASLAVCMAVFSKYSTWPMLSVLPVISAVFIKDAPKKILGRSLAVFSLAGLVVGILIVVHYDLFHKQIMILRTYQLAGLERWKEGFLSTFLFQTQAFITVFALYGIYRAVRNKDLRFLVAAWFVVLVLVLQIRRIRYIIPLFPLFGLMAAYGLHLFKDRGVRQYVALSIVASSLAVAYCAYLPFLSSSGMANLKHAGQYLDTLNCDAVEVFALPQKSSSGSTFAAIPILDYHTKKKIATPQDWPHLPQDGSAETSSLRFTWEMGEPAIYSRPDAGKRCAVAVISSEVIEKAPEELTLIRPRLLRELARFDWSSGAFRYQTIVTIFSEN